MNDLDTAAQEVPATAEDKPDNGKPADTAADSAVKAAADLAEKGTDHKPKQRRWSATERAAARAATEVEVGGTVFYPSVKLTPPVMRDVRRKAREVDDLMRLARADERRVTKAYEADENSDAELDLDLLEKSNDATMRNVYEQLTMLLRDKEGTPPTTDWLEKHLDQRDAGPLLRFVMGQDQGDDSADPSAT